LATVISAQISKVLARGGAGPSGTDVIAAEMKEVVDRLVRPKSPLRLLRGLEPLHLPIAPSRRLM